MHWLSMVGIVLISIGAFCTYWGVELKHRDTEAPSANTEALRADYANLHSKSAMLQEDNERLRADNVTLSLRHKRAEEDAEVFKYRALETQRELNELRKALEAAGQDVPAVAKVEEPAKPPRAPWPAEPAAETAATRPEDTPAPEPVEEKSEVEIIDHLQQLLVNRAYDELQQAASEQTRLHPDWMTPYVYLGVANRHLGRRQQALQAFVHVVEHGGDDPAYPRAERALKLMTSGIQEHAERNEWKQLVEASERSLEKDPDWVLPLYFAGLAHSHLDNKQKAIDSLSLFLERAGDDPERGRAERALRLLQTNILELQKQGDYPALIRACERELEQDPDWLTPYYLLGLSYARLGNVTKAREHLETFVRRGADDPDYANAVRLLESLE